VTISPSFSLYRIVVFPAASRPTIKILISFFPQSRSKSFENVRPMIARWGDDAKWVLLVSDELESVKRTVSRAQYDKGT
jgi:hypothetical protein